MTFADFFTEAKKKFMEADASGVNEHLAYQFNVTGEASGIFYVEVRDGNIYVEPYEYYDRDAIFICSENNLIKIADGRLDPVNAFLTGRLKVEGNIDKALKLKELIANKKKS